MYIRLEYSEQTGQFHFSRVGEFGESSFGYVTLSSKMQIEDAESFCNQMRNEFPELIIPGMADYPSTLVMRAEYQFYNYTLKRAVREQLQLSYDRRLSIILN